MWMDEAQCMITQFHTTLALDPSSQAHLVPLPAFPLPILPIHNSIQIKKLL
jgi:hypothetical protein